MACKRLLAELKTAAAVIARCPSSLSVCHERLHSSLGSALEDRKLSSAPTTQQQERLAAALLSVLQALADERHPGDDAWQTATLAALLLVRSWPNKKLVSVHHLGSPAGRDALLALVQRLHDCHEGKGPPLSAHGVFAVLTAAEVVFAVCGGAPTSDDAVDAAVPSLRPLALLLLAMVVRLFAPPSDASRHRPAGACTCPRRATGAAGAAGLLSVDGLPEAAVLVYGLPHRGTDAVYSALAMVSCVCQALTYSSVYTPGPLVWAQFRSLSSMVLALQVHGARQRRNARAFAGAAGAANPARFMDAAFLPRRPTRPAPPSTNYRYQWQGICAAAATMDPQHAPPCLACLPEQLMLALEAASLVDYDPQQAAEAYAFQRHSWGALGDHGGAAAARLCDFWRRAWPHLAARALEATGAVRQAPEGSEASSHHATTFILLAEALVGCVAVGCQADDGAALDAICEAVARAQHPQMLRPACLLFYARLACILMVSANPRQREGSLPVAFAAASASMGKMVHVCPDFGDVLANLSQLFVDTVQAAVAKLSADGRRCATEQNDDFGGGRGLAADRSTQDAGGEAAGGAGGTLRSVRRNQRGAASTAGEGGGTQPWVQLVVWVAARVQGAAARRWLQRRLLAGGAAEMTVRECKVVTAVAAQLQLPVLWDAVQRATHGRIAPFDIRHSRSPDSNRGQPTAPDAAGGGANAQSGTQNLGGRSGNVRDEAASACTAALRFLAELHDWLDPHALGVRMRGCYNPRCTNVSGASESELPVHLCSRCRVALYCSAACSKQHWRCHKVTCRPAASGAQP